MYSLSSNSSAIYEVSPAGKVDQSRADFANSPDTTDGLFYTTRIVDYEGSEHYCATSDPSSCSAPPPLSLHVTHGYDNMTGIGAPNSGFGGSLVAAAK